MSINQELLNESIVKKEDSNNLEILNTNPKAPSIRTGTLYEKETGIPIASYKKRDRDYILNLHDDFLDLHPSLKESKGLMKTFSNFISRKTKPEDHISHFLQKAHSQGYRDPLKIDFHEYADGKALFLSDHDTGETLLSHKASTGTKFYNDFDTHLSDTEKTHYAGFIKNKFQYGVSEHYADDISDLSQRIKNTVEKNKKNAPYATGGHESMLSSSKTYRITTTPEDASAKAQHHYEAQGYKITRHSPIAFHGVKTNYGSNHTVMSVVSDGYLHHNESKYSSDPKTHADVLRHGE